MQATQKQTITLQTNEKSYPRSTIRPKERTSSSRDPHPNRIYL